MSRTAYRTTRSGRAASITALTVAALVLAACGGNGDDPGTGDGEVEPIDRLQIMAPADPGGGWDQTARAIAASLEEEGLAGSVQGGA